MHLSYRAELDAFIDILKSIKEGPGSEVLLQQFSAHHLSELIDLLIHLRSVKDREELRRLDDIKKSDGRTVVEGFSDIDIKEAFKNALDKVAQFFSEIHDVSVTVLGLVHLPKGGYRATLEVHLTPVTDNFREKLNGHDVELKHRKEKKYVENKDMEEKRASKLILDHFMRTSGTTPHIPDFFMVNIDDEELYNRMIEKEFFHSAHTLLESTWNLEGRRAALEEPIPQIMVRCNKKPTPDDS